MYRWGTISPIVVPQGIETASALKSICNETEFEQRKMRWQGNSQKLHMNVTTRCFEFHATTSS